ncbi:MAG: MFS transporter [Saprospiraceae bacterium]|nr:MFS transporter [Saprospiraceae bacterium]
MQKQLLVKLSVLQFLQFYIWGSWFVTAGTYFLQNLEFSGREVALIYASFSIAATITPLFLGILADKLFAVERLLAFLHFFGALLLYFLSITTSFYTFYVLMFLYVLCYVPTFSLSSSMCFHHIENVKKDFPIVRVWGSVAWIIASSAVGFLNIEDKNIPFQIAASASLLLSIYCLFLPHTPPQPTKATSFWKSLKGEEIGKLIKNRSLVIMVICVGLISIPVSYYYSFVNPFLNEIGVENAASKMALGQVVEIVLMLLLPMFFRIMRFKTIIFIGLLLWGLRYGMFMAGYTYDLEWLLILGLMVHGFAYIFALLSVQIYLDTKVPVSLRSTAQGFFSLLTMGIMAIIGAAIAGEFVQYYELADGSHDWNSIWNFPAVFGIIVAIVFFVLFKDKSKNVIE